MKSALAVPVALGPCEENSWPGNCCLVCLEREIVPGTQRQTLLCAWKHSFALVASPDDQIVITQLFVSFWSFFP